AYLPGEMADEAGVDGWKVPLPDRVLLALGYGGELLRMMGFRVPGLVRARSMASDQDLSRLSDTAV
ncbi:MAG: hypothetical protein ABEJ98_00515, partial [Candidatus Nanohaloarchaea archaeon]